MLMAGLALDSTPLTRTSPAVGGVTFWSDPMDEARLWSRIKPSADGCWEWTGDTKSQHGYGLVFWKGHNTRVHRVVYELLIGSIPDGLTIDHLCRVRHCVNPTHLEPVTGRENTLRGFGHTAVNARKTHCIHGHPFTPENTHHYSSRPKARICRACIKIRSREQARTRVR